jgi:acyl-CoA synthetase (AMP-forming)/AMP-acid ligase II
MAFNDVASFLLDGKDPVHVALRLPQEAWTYGDLQRESSRVAARLAEMGVGQGDRVILLSDNSLYWVAAYIGTLRTGAVVVPLPTTTSAQDFEYIRESTNSQVAFVQARFAARNAAMLGSIRLITDADLKADSAPIATNSPEIKRGDLAAIMFTSGSTGQPRGVMISHGNIIANTESIVEYLTLTSADSIMAVLPFHYCFGTSLLHTHLAVGGTVAIDNRFRYPETILQRMIEENCTGFAGVPSHYQILLRTSSIRKKQFPALRYVQQAGGHLAPVFLAQLREALPATQVFVMYGQTEATARLSYLAPENLDAKAGSIGKGMTGVTLRVIDDSGKDVAHGEAGAVGEIVATGENVALGYWAAPEETAAIFRNGALHTGDLAKVDEDGFIYVVDRAKDFLKCGGKRVSCGQIEDQLVAFEDLVEAAVVGIPDEVLGEAVLAYVVPRAGAGEDIVSRLEQFWKSTMLSHIVPKEIIVLQALPKNTSGKLARPKLKEMAALRHHSAEAASAR